MAELLKNRKAIILILSFVSVTFSTQIKVACIGNSITSGFSNTGISYTPKLQELLGNDYTVYNAGVSGTTLLKNGDNTYWKTGRITEVLTFNPDIVTIKLGTNDTKQQNWDVHGSEFKQDYEALIDTLNTLTVKPTIFLVIPVPVFPHAVSISWGIRDSIILKMIPIIREIADERGLQVIDAHTPLVLFPQYFSVDGVHPDSNGADTIANVIYRSITGGTTDLARSFSANPDRNFRCGVIPIINGNLNTVFAGMKPGCRYEISIFDAAGRIMIHKGYLDLSPASQNSLRSMFSGKNSMRLVVIKNL